MSIRLKNSINATKINKTAKTALKNKKGVPLSSAATQSGTVAVVLWFSLTQ